MMLELKPSLCKSKCKIELVFLDRNMPLMGGLEAARILR